MLTMKEIARNTFLKGLVSRNKNVMNNTQTFVKGVMLPVKRNILLKLGLRNILLKAVSRNSLYH